MSKLHAIIELYRAGVFNLTIIKQLKVPKSTVYDAVARFKELGDDKNRPRSECPRTARTILKFNPQNDRVLAKQRDNIPEHMKTVHRRHKPVSAMVWAAVSKA